MNSIIVFKVHQNKLLLQDFGGFHHGGHHHRGYHRFGQWRHRQSMGFLKDDRVLLYILIGYGLQKIHNVSRNLLRM